MGIPVEAISSRAESSGAPIAFGERCAAFINSDLRNAIQLGAEQRDVIAGLVQSIADNYISRVVGVRPIGETLLFQGGVAFNCQASVNAQALIRPIANEADVPYISLDMEGPWVSANQGRLLETIAVQARRLSQERSRAIA